MFQRITNIRNQPRLSIIGKIRLGERNARGQPEEAGHFIFDIADPFHQERALQIYGPHPTVIDIMFFTDLFDYAFRCTLQRWGRSRKGTPYLLCEGNGHTAIAEERIQPCPCSCRGSECRKTTVLKFLIPSITMGGYFLLATKSEYSARQIETSLRLISATTGGLTTQPFRLKRTSGYATVNGMKIRKYFVALEADDVTPSMQLPGSSLPGIQRISDERHVPLDLPLPADKSYAVARREEQRIREGRRKVKEKIRLFIMHPQAEKALEEYASNFFKKRFFDDLSAEELLFLWHAIEDNPSVAGEIFKLAMGNTQDILDKPFTP